MQPSSETPVATQRPAGNPWGTPSPVPAAGASPWGKTSSPVATSFEEVMSEELAKKLQTDEHEKEWKLTNPSESPNAEWFAQESNDTSNDVLLAQYLQHQFDTEHDTLLKLEEEKLNGPSKVKLSFNNYKAVHPVDEENYRSSEDEALEAGYDEEEEQPIVFKNGLSGKGKNVISKHDANLSGKRNANKVIDNFPPEFDLGDAHKVKMRLPNHVYNKLKRHSAAETKRATRLHEKKEHSTADMAMDEKTRLILYKLMNRGILNEVHGIFSTGKESVLLHADGGRMDEGLVPRECAIKVFKTTLQDFKTRAQYVKGDMRFFKDDFKKHNPRRIIKIWAEKEDHNLRRLANVGVPVPQCIMLKKNVLVMSFIGENQIPAPKLKDARLSHADMQIAYDTCIENMKKMYREANLVHADLSEYNMLWHKDQLYFIDVSQSVEKQHPLAMVFLLRDCKNILEFFSRNGVPQLPSKYELFNEVTGLNLGTEEGKNFLQQIQEYERDERNLREDKGKDFPFEYFYDRATQERLEANEEAEYEDEQHGDESSGDSEGEEEEVAPSETIQAAGSEGQDTETSDGTVTQSQDTQSNLRVDKLKLGDK